MKYKKCLIKKGDTVKVITGKDKGTIAKIIDFDRKRGLVKVEGVRMQAHFPSKKEGSTEKEIIFKEGFISHSNVMIINSDQQVTRLKRVLNENKKYVRTAIKGVLLND